MGGIVDGAALGEAVGLAVGEAVGGVEGLSEGTSEASDASVVADLTTGVAHQSSISLESVMLQIVSPNQSSPS